MPLSAAEYQTVVRNDFYSFMHRAFGELNPRVPFLHNWHIELIAAKLQACLEGKITRLIINVPPRSLKSHAAAVSFPAFRPRPQAEYPNHLRQLRSGPSEQTLVGLSNTNG